MKTVIVYYSLEGNTEYAAEEMAKRLGADLLKLVPKKAYPTGKFKKFFWGGKSAVMGEVPALEPYAFDLSSYDLVILGFPVWASNIAPPLRTFVKENDLKGARVAAFACEGGSGSEKAFAKLKACMGIDDFEAELVLIDPKARPDEKNEKLISDFCDKLTESGK